MVITEYDLPDRTIQPHDVMVDADGIVWHSDFSGQILGRFDTRTLTHKSFAVPLQREGWPTGALDLETDPQGNLWLGLMFQARRGEVRSQDRELSDVPTAGRPAQGELPAGHGRPAELDRRQPLWLQDPARRGIYRMDMTNGETELFEPFAKTRGSPYSIFSDKENNSGSSISAARMSARSTPATAR